MICAISSYETSSAPSSGTFACPFQERSSSSRAAIATMSRVAQVGIRWSPDTGGKNMPWLLIGWSCSGRL